MARTASYTRLERSESRLKPSWRSRSRTGSRGCWPPSSRTCSEQTEGSRRRRYPRSSNPFHPVVHVLNKRRGVAAAVTPGHQTPLGEADLLAVSCRKCLMPVQPIGLGQVTSPAVRFYIPASHPALVVKVQADVVDITVARVASLRVQESTAAV